MRTMVIWALALFVAPFGAAAEPAVATGGIIVDSNQGFLALPGIVGKGTVEDPFVISGVFDAKGGEFGLRIRGTSAHFVIQDAQFKNASQAGLWLENVSNGWIVGCVFEGNEVGARVDGTAEVTFTLNTFRNNSRHGMDGTKGARWDDGHVGNYWEGYTGSDPDSDGIGNVPWEVAPATPQHGPKVDRFPLAAPIVGREPPEGAVLLQSRFTKGDQWTVRANTKVEISWNMMGLRMPITAENDGVYEELVIGCFGAGSYFDVRVTIKEDTGSVTVFGIPQEYESSAGRKAVYRIHRFGASEILEGEELGITPPEFVGWPARWVVVGDSWAHSIEMGAQDLGISDGTATYRGVTVFERVEDREGKSLAVLVTKGVMELRGKEYIPLLGEGTLTGQGEFNITEYVDLSSGRTVESTASITVSATLRVMGETVGSMDVKMSMSGREQPTRKPPELLAVVTAVDRDRGLVLISAGSDQGVRPGDRFRVQRVFRLADGSEIEEYRGLIEVQEILSADRSACRIIEAAFPIEVGDWVRPVQEVPPEAGDFTLPATLTLAVPINRAGTVDIPLTPPEGKHFPVGDITFSIKEPLPTGVKATFNPAKITAKGDEESLKTTLTVEVGVVAKTGAYTLTVVAKAGGITRESKLTLIVQVAPDYSLEVSPATVTVKQGASATVTVNVKRNEVMKDPVNLAVSGAPTGMKVTVDPATVPADKASATLKIEVPATGVDAKDYTLTIRGKAMGIADKTAALKVTVQLVDFSLKVEPSVVTLAPGGTATVTITITRTNHTDAVRFTAEGLPAGVTATLDPASATGNTVTLTLAAASDAAPATANVVVKGTDGVRIKTTTLSLTVTPPGG